MENILKNYKIIREINGGAFGKIYSAMNNKQKNIVHLIIAQTNKH